MGVHLFATCKRPMITGISPNPVSTSGGTSITITGEHMNWTASAQAFAFFTSYTVTSGTTATGTVPAHVAGATDLLVWEGATGLGTQASNVSNGGITLTYT